MASGGTGRALQAVPPADRYKVVHAAHHAFVTGFNTIALVSVAVAAVGSVAGYALVRSRDFVAAGGPAAAPPKPVGVCEQLVGGGAGFGHPPTAPLAAPATPGRGRPF